MLSLGILIYGGIFFVAAIVWFLWLRGVHQTEPSTVISQTLNRSR